MSVRVWIPWWLAIPLALLALVRWILLAVSWLVVALVKGTFIVCQAIAETIHERRGERLPRLL